MDADPTLENRKVREADWEASNAAELAALKKKFPTGKMPWLKGLLYITGKRSETEAIVPFKRFSIHGTGKGTEQSKAEERVISKLKLLRQEGFDLSDIQSTKFRLRWWYRDPFIPGERRVAGQRGRTKNRSLTR